MGFNIKSWNDPVALDSNNLNRIEQGIKNAHDTLEITNEEVSNIQNKQLEILQSLNSLTQNNPEILNTLSKINTILADNNMEEILSNTETFLRKSEQSLTSEELTQVYKNLKLNTFLKLTSIKVNGEDVVAGSEVNIEVPKVDNTLNIYSSNAISNKAVAKLLQDFKPSVTVPTTLAELLEDKDHQTVTAAEKAKWNSNTGGGSSGGIVVETDPTVPNWAKASHKPFYSYSEILDTPNNLSEFNNDLEFTTTTYVDSEITKLQNTSNAYVDSEITKLQNLLLGPDGDDALDTINELASAIESNSDIITTLNQAITNKAPKDHTHTKSEITDFTHTHTKSEITDFTHTHSYLPLSGGQLTGRISFKDNNALPEADSLNFVLGIDSYANGGGIKYTTNNKLHVGSATKAAYLTGFDSASTAQSWGNQVGTYVMGMRSAKANSADIGEIAFRQDNPKQGQLSMIIDGTVYVNEGKDEVFTKAGGTMTGPIVLNGGDGTTSGNIQLLANGQITDGSTATLFGRVSTSANNLIVGHGNYAMQLRGKNGRPTYNGNELALKSDAAGVVSKGSQAPQQNRTQAYEDVYTYNTYSTHNGLVPTNYTSVIGFGDGAAGTVEIAGCWTSEMGLWYRALRDCTDNWWPWQQIITQRGGSIASGYTLTINGTLVI